MTKNDMLTRAQNFIRALDFIAPFSVENTVHVLDAVAEGKTAVGDVAVWTLCDESQVVRIGDRFESRNP